MTAATMAQGQMEIDRRKVHMIFNNKQFYLHFRCSSRRKLAQKFVVAFGGMIHTFLDPKGVNYVLTDVSMHELDSDPILARAIKHRIKPMSYDNLKMFCQRYVTSSSASDEEDYVKVQANELRAPYIKFENKNDRYAPTARELPEWPRINLERVNCGESIFSLGQRHGSTTTTQPPTPRHTNNTNTRQSSAQLPIQTNPRHRRPIGSRTCDLCSEKFERVGQLDEHLESKEHLAKIAETNWDEVENVIAALPSIETFATPRAAQSGNTSNDRESFVCLTPIETIDDLFQITAK